MKKSIIFLLATVLLITFLTACNSIESADRLDAIRQRGYLEICTEPYFAPNEFIDPTLPTNQQVIGLDIEIAQYIADKIGVPLKIVPLEFGAVLTGVAEGKYDLALSALAYSPERANAMNLSMVYQPSDEGYGFLVRIEDVDKYTSIDSVKDAVIIAQSGSVQESLYNANIETCREFKRVSSSTDAYLAVSEGKADIAICAITSANLYAEVNNSLTTTSFRFDVDPNMNGTVIAAPKNGTDSLIQLVNECITELTATGQIEQWEAEYTAYAKTLGLD